MRFTIITVTYNAEKFLAQTLDSVICQDFDDYEHLVWDGGSIDRTLEIALRYPVRICQGRDCGIADAMNKGAKRAQGEFIIHLHADDFLAHPTVLSKIDTALRQHPQVDWLYGDSYIIDEHDELRRYSKLTPFSKKRLKRYNLLTHPSTCIRRALFEKIGGFNTDLKYCMDYELWLRLSKGHTPFPLHTPIACFREHEGSLSTSLPLKVADEAYFVRNQHIKGVWQKYRSYRTWRKRRHAHT